MPKSFQKSANTLQELHLPHPGIINTNVFDKHFELHCYKTSPDLQPFVTHIWTQRLKQPISPLYKTPVEIIPGPNVYLFFTAESAFVHGVARHELVYNALTPGVIAGVKFQPGGFYPFVQRPVSELATATPPIATILPGVDKAFRNKLLNQPDDLIVRMIEDLLRSSHPKTSKQLVLVTEIMHELTTNPSLKTVSATARTFSMSERSLQLLFQTHVGVGVKWIITRRRLLDAISRVQSQPHPAWVEVAAELGYSSQSHFSREFKEITGLTPSEYLKSLES